MLNINKTFNYSQLIVSLSSMPKQVLVGKIVYDHLEQREKYQNVNENLNVYDTVVASVVEYNADIDYERIIEFMVELDNLGSFTKNKKFIIINVGTNYSMKPNIKIDNDYLKLIYLNIKSFMIYINSEGQEFKNSDSIKEYVKLSQSKKGYKIKPQLFNNINYLYKLNLVHLFEKENLNSSVINYNIIFIFKDITWSNIVSLLRVRGIKVYGGSGSKNHILSTVQAKLSMFLFLANDLHMDYDLIYKSFKSDVTHKTKLNNILAKFTKLNNESDIIEFKKRNVLDSSYEIIQYININNMISTYNHVMDIYNKLINLSDSQNMLLSDIRTDKERIKSHSFKDATDYNNKKVSSATKRINENTSKLTLINQEIGELEGEYKIHLHKLYYIDKSLFNDEGICSLNPNLSIDLNVLNESNNISSNDHTTNINSPNNKTNFSNQKREYSTLRRLSCSRDLKSGISENIITNDLDNKTKNIFIDYLEEIITESDNDPVKSQTKLEEKWIENMVTKLDSFEYKSKYSLQSIINKANETLKLSEYNVKKRFPEFYQLLNKDHLIITYSILTTFYNKLGFTTIAFKVANGILYDLYSKYDFNLNSSNSKSIFDIDNILKLRLGAYFIEIFCRKPTALFERSYKQNEFNLDQEINDHDLAILVVNEEFFNLINNQFMISSASLPMLCLPNKWSDSEYGGFLNNFKLKESIITGSKHHKHTMENKQVLYDSINRLNSIQFKINKTLLNYLINEGKFVLDYYFKNLKNNTDKNQSVVTLKLANSYSKLNSPFYISHNTDWRGRIYTQSFYLSYQGGDLSNALIQLYEGLTLTEQGLNYLYIYGANCYDEHHLSKQSFESRIQWVKNNYLKIIHLDKNFILKAKSLMLFTSFCLTLRELHHNPNTKVFSPVFLDATCSGIQHLSALIKDLDSGKKVNLIPQTPQDKVEDLYSELIEPINNAINQYGEDNLDFSDFKYIKLGREHIKLPIMTKVYNVSLLGMADQLRNSFEEITPKNKELKNHKLYLVPSKNNKKILLRYNEIYILAKVINNQIFKNLPSLEYIYTYLMNMVRLCLKLNIPLVWFTPSGLKITQFYTLSEPHKVSITFGHQTKSVILRESINKVNTRKQVQAIIPNIIHSLDASHLMNLINRGLFNSYPILTIHDCFGTHPNNIEELKNKVTLEFVNLYIKPDFISNFHKRMLQAISDNQILIHKDDENKDYIVFNNKKLYLPSLPHQGKLNILDILKSQYLIT